MGNPAGMTFHIQRSLCVHSDCQLEHDKCHVWVYDKISQSDIAQSPRAVVVLALKPCSVALNLLKVPARCTLVLVCNLHILLHSFQKRFYVHHPILLLLIRHLFGFRVANPSLDLPDIVDALQKYSYVLIIAVRSRSIRPKSTDVAESPQVIMHEVASIRLPKGAILTSSLSALSFLERIGVDDEGIVALTNLSVSWSKVSHKLLVVLRGSFVGKDQCGIPRTLLTGQVDIVKRKMEMGILRDVNHDVM